MLEISNISKSSLIRNRRILLNPRTCRRFGSNACQIPASTWSLRDLKLTASSGLVSRQELDTLARRSLIDLPEDTTDLQYHLSNMLHCVAQVNSVDISGESEQDLYDNPRGMTSAPTRALCTNRNADKYLQEEETKLVWDNYLQPRTTKHGDHKYFAIVTQKSETV
mmetsp:Transcript_24822/g.36731  ORF Transcript_24822/g.36731 Transcript_24822/m.36731 type:complete len:166 (-) Transcript_24822:58-555(-)